MPKSELKCKLRAGKYLVPATLIYDGSKIFLQFPYNKKLLKEVKSLQGARWHGFDEENPKKMWSISASPHNMFQLQYLMGADPYAPYDAEPIQIDRWYRPLFQHQREMVQNALTYKRCILACEMGTGKTLAAIEILERAGYEDIWYIAPRSGIVAVEREFVKWKSSITPKFMTYEKLVKTMRGWQSGDPAPHVVIFDESSKLKNPTSYRSQEALHLADSMREEHGDDCYIILMSGTPAPKAPTDWWNQAEVACPGFLKEGTHGKFKTRLCIIEERKSNTGGVYPYIVSWLDDVNKCAKCGIHKDEHDEANHPFEESVNEVAKLHRRMKGLVLVKLKKDCTDLPEKQYEVITAKPTAEMLRAAKLIKAKSSRAVSALILLRELSDGFQYTEEQDGTEPCPNCHGKKVVNEPVPLEEVDILAPQDISEDDFQTQEVECGYCNGTGEVPHYIRTTTDVKSPKDDVLIDQLDMHEDLGRLVVWCGFTGTIDRVVDICHQQGWTTIRVDGRGYHAQTPKGEILNGKEMLDCMDNSHPKTQDLKDAHPKVCFVGHPRAGGMGLTLHASPTALFYSNDFDGEARQQAEDRIHRMGMDHNKGAKIVDIFCLATDKLVLENLKKKKALQKISLGEIEEALDGSE